MAIRAAGAQRARRVHGWLIGLRVAGNASGAFAVGFLLRLAHQVGTSLFIGGAKRRRGNARGHRCEEQAHSQCGPRRDARKPGKDIAICHPAIHSVFRRRTDRSWKIIFF
jgi:hypothetical protein